MSVKTRKSAFAWIVFTWGRYFAARSSKKSIVRVPSRTDTHFTIGAANPPTSSARGRRRWSDGSAVQDLVVVVARGRLFVEEYLIRRGGLTKDMRRQS